MKKRTISALFIFPLFIFLIPSLSIAQLNGSADSQAGCKRHVVVEFRRNQTTVFPEREGADCVFSKGTSGTSILNNAASLVAPQVESKP